MLRRCPGCDGVLLSYVAAEAINLDSPGPGDGQAHPVAALVCDDCSELVVVLTFDEVIARLNQHRGAE